MRGLVIVLIALVMGITLGLLFGWVLWPIQYSEANPTLLRDEYRHDYLQMIAAIYAADADLRAAQERLAHLGPDSDDELLRLTTDLILAGEDESRTAPLARLSIALGLSSPVLRPFQPPDAQEQPGRGQ